MARKDLQHKWFDLPYLSTNDVIQEVIKHWPTDLHSPSNLAMGTSKSTENKKKDVEKQVVQQLAEKRRNEVEEKAQLEKECVAK